MNTYHVVNSVKWQGKYYQKDEPIELEEGLAKTLLLKGTIIDKTAETKDIKKPVQENILVVKPDIDETFVNPFTDLGVNDKQAKILFAAGYKTEEQIGQLEASELSKIDGISKTLAKKITDCFE